MTVVQRIELCLKQIDDWIAPDGVEGAAVSVWLDGTIVATRYAGQAQPGVPVDATTIFALASITKPMTAAVIMALAEQGLINLEEPVARLIPEFVPPSEAGQAMPELESLRSQVTIRHLLCHLSGLPEDLPATGPRFRDAPNLEVLVDAMCRLPLLVKPGTKLIYSNAGFALLGRIVERATNNNFWNIAAQLVLEPLDLQNTYGPPPPTLNDRIAIVADAPRPGSLTEAYNSSYWRSLGIPWGGMYGTPVDMATMAAAFLDNADNFLSATSRQRMTTDQVDGLPGTVQAVGVEWPIAWWGLGWEVKGMKQHHWTGELTSPGTFSHFGASGTLVWADPAIGLAVAMFGNRATTRGWPFRPPRWTRLSNSLVVAVG